MAFKTYWLKENKSSLNVDKIEPVPLNFPQTN